MASLSNTKKELAARAADHLRALLTESPIVYVVIVHRTRKTSYIKVLYIRYDTVTDVTRLIRDAALQHRSTQHGVRGTYIVRELSPSAVIQHVQDRLDLLKIGKQIDVREI